MKRWQVIGIAVVVILGTAILAGYRVGVRLLQDKVIVALGPGSRLSELKVNWFSIELLGLTIDAPKDWPAARTLRADRVTIVPDLRTLLSDQIRVASIVVEKPYLSVLRTSGKLILVPSLMQTESSLNDIPSTQSNARTLLISTIKLENGSLDLYDATVSRPPLRTRVEDIQAVIRDVATPASDKTHFEVAGIVKGVKRDGRAEVSGWVGPDARDSSSRITLEAVDLVALQPYLVRKNEAKINNGSLDLNLASEVRNNNLDGKGKIVLHDLEFAPARGFFDTFMGLPRNAVIGFLKDNDNVIDAEFTLKGNTSNPNFSLNESLSTRIAAAMAGELGISIQSAAEGLGSLGRKGLEGAGSVVEGVGSAVRQLFGGGRK
jgi:hypothetical protein